MAVGYIESLQWLDYGDKAINIDQWDAVDFDWDIAMPYLAQSPITLMATMADNSPVPMIHWSGGAVLMSDPMEHWRHCLDLMMHI